MSLADRDIQKIADAVAERFGRARPQGIVDAVYKKLDENALSGIRNASTESTVASTQWAKT